jgi:hypothetical protein
VLPCCCILLLYQARELWAQDFEFICLTWVELRGFEPLTSCMPSTGSTSTAVRLCRSLSQGVRTNPAKSAPVAVLSRCTNHRSFTRVRPWQISMTTGCASSTCQESAPAMLGS